MGVPIRALAILRPKKNAQCQSRTQQSARKSGADLVCSSLYSLVPLTGNVYLSPKSTNLTLASYINCAGFGVVVNVGWPSSEKGQCRRVNKRFYVYVLNLSFLPSLHGRINILSAEADGVSSCFFSFVLAALKPPPLTGKMRYSPRSSVKATSVLLSPVSRFLRKTVHYSSCQSSLTTCKHLENLMVTTPSSTYPSLFARSCD